MMECMSIDNRQYQRKVFRTTVKVALSQDQVYEGKSVNLSVDGICVVIKSRNLPSGQMCRISFDVWVQGKTRTVTVQGKVVYSICSAEGFKLGMHFVQIDAGSVAFIEAFLIGK